MQQNYAKISGVTETVKVHRPGGRRPAHERSARWPGTMSRLVREYSAAPPIVTWRSTRCCKFW